MLERWVGRGTRIGRPPVLYIEYAQRLRAYLGYQPFDQERLKRWLDERAICQILP
jgi:hypothetical protein